MMTLRIGSQDAPDITPPIGRAGLSLIELILVMALLATVAAIVVPQFSGFSAGRTYDGEWNRLRAFIHYARNEAISRSEVVEIRFDTERGAYGLTRGYGPAVLPGNVSGDASEHVLPRQLAVEFSDDTAPLDGAVTVVFRPDGTVDDPSPLEIRLIEREGVFQRTLRRDPLLGYRVPVEEQP